jgi:hypothetical protein
MRQDVLKKKMFIEAVTKAALVESWLEIRL